MFQIAGQMLIPTGSLELASVACNLHTAALNAHPNFCPLVKVKPYAPENHPAYIYQDHPHFQNSSQAVPKLEVKLTTHQIKRRQ